MKNNKWFFAIVLLIILLLYIFSLGNVDTSDKLEKEVDKNSNLKLRHKKLKDLVRKKKDLFKKLNKKFRWIYFGVRLILAFLFIAYNLMLYFIFNITELGDLLNWNQVVVVVIALFSFITFGTFNNVKEYVQKIKLRLEVRVFSKYVSIPQEIEKHKVEMTKLSIAIESSNDGEKSLNA